MRRLLVVLVFALLVIDSGCSDDVLGPEPTPDWQWQQAYVGDDLLNIVGSDAGFRAVGRKMRQQHSNDGVSWNVSGGQDWTADLNDIVVTDEGKVAVGTRGWVITETERVSAVLTPAYPFDLEGVAYSGARLVAVGSRPQDGVGGIFTSEDKGLTWNGPVTMDSGLHDVVWNGFKFVAGGDQGFLAISADGLHWDTFKASMNESLIQLLPVGEKLVGLGDHGGIYVSTDSYQWSRTATIQGHPKALAAGSGMFLAVGDAGKIWTSDDLVRWGSVQSGTTSHLHGIAWAAGAFVVVGDAGVVLRSADGHSWHRENGGLPLSLTDARWTGSQFLILDATASVLSSPDGLTWQRHDFGDGDVLIGELVDFPGGYIVFNQGAGKSWSSPDGVTWGAHATDHASQSIAHAIWVEDRFLAVGTAGVFQGSTDGMHWTQLPAFTQQGVLSLATGGGKVLASAADGTMYISEDNGLTWESQGVVGRFYRIHWNERWGFLAAGWSALAQSQDGSTWTWHGIPDLQLSGVFVAGDRIFAVGNNGGVASSTDLTNWISEESGTTNYLTAGAASPNMIISVGYSGILLTKGGLVGLPGN